MMIVYDTANMYLPKMTKDIVSARVTGTTTTNTTNTTTTNDNNTTTGIISSIIDSIKENPSKYIDVKGMLVSKFVSNKQVSVTPPSSSSSLPSSSLSSLSSLSSSSSPSLPSSSSSSSPAHRQSIQTMR
jgi:hypothetical protein